jgi:hypothetical protein
VELETEHGSDGEYTQATGAKGFLNYRFHDTIFQASTALILQIRLRDQPLVETNLLIRKSKVMILHLAGKAFPCFSCPECPNFDGGGHFGLQWEEGPMC